MEENGVRLQERAEEATEFMLNKPKKTKSALERAEDERMVRLLLPSPPLSPSQMPQARSRPLPTLSSVCAPLQDAFIKQSERCWLCKQFYAQDENHDMACWSVLRREADSKEEQLKPQPKTQTSLPKILNSCIQNICVPFLQKFTSACL